LRKWVAAALLIQNVAARLANTSKLHELLPGNPDLVFPRLRKVIFVSGCFWHMHGCGRCRIPSSRRNYWVKKLERNAARDKRMQRALRRAGWGVMVVWECQTQGATQERLQTRLLRFLNTAN
jgi:DNA mismatch endonuclease, patch repair protein